MFVPLPVPLMSMPTYSVGVVSVERRSSIDYARIDYSARQMSEKLNHLSTRLETIERKINASAITHEEVVKLKENLGELSNKAYAEYLFDEQNYKNDILRDLGNNIRTRLKISADVLDELGREYQHYLRSCTLPAPTLEKTIALTRKSDSNVLPSDVLREIFSLLPLRKLINLRSVCKQWRNVIDETVLKGVVVLPNFHGKKGLIINTNSLDHPLKLHDVMTAIAYVRKKQKWFHFGGQQSLTELLDKSFRESVKDRQISPQPRLMG